MGKFVINQSKQEQLSDAISMAISYCQEHIPTADTWSKQSLEKHLQNFYRLRDGIGNSFVVGHFE